MSRTTDTDVSPAERVAFINAMTPDSMFLSLHFGDSQANVRGVATYVLPSRESTRPRERSALALATAVHSQIVGGTKCPDRGIGRGFFGELKESERDGVLIEGGSLLHSEESALIDKAEYRNHLAIAIAKGVEQYRAVMAPAR